LEKKLEKLNTIDSLRKFFQLPFVVTLKGSGFCGDCSFCIGKKEPKTLDEKNAKHKASSRTLIFRRSQPAPLLTDHHA